MTNDLLTGQANVYKSIDYSNSNLDGMWTYVYFSYSRKLRSAVGMLQNQGESVSTIQMDVVHPVPTNLRFVLGGSNVLYLIYYYSSICTQDSMAKFHDLSSESGLVHSSPIAVNLPPTH